MSNNEYTIDQDEPNFGSRLNSMPSSTLNIRKNAIGKIKIEIVKNIHLKKD